MPMHRRTAGHRRIDVQVFLDDAACVAELRRIIHQALARAAFTWAPMPLPIDRVVVGAGSWLSATGRADEYGVAPQGNVNGRGDGNGSLVVVTLGTGRRT